MLQILAHRRVAANSNRPMDILIPLFTDFPCDHRCRTVRRDNNWRTELDICFGAVGFGDESHDLATLEDRVDHLCLTKFCPVNNRLLVDQAIEIAPSGDIWRMFSFVKMKMRRNAD